MVAMITAWNTSAARQLISMVITPPTKGPAAAPCAGRIVPSNGN